MNRLPSATGKVYDQDPERCPECGRPISHVDNRGDAVAFVHVVDRPSECLK